jgi:N,N-dimethylformamidase beta subunit-like protein
VLRALAAALLLAQPASGGLPPPASGQPRSNPTAAENARPGSDDWEIARPARDREIEGYASRTSVNAGDAIDLFVHTSDPRYTIDVFRTGWYGGRGARRVAGPIDRDGAAQPVPAPDATGLVECRWRDPLHLETRDALGPWPSGVYLARLTAHPSGAQAYLVFVVRDDARAAAIIFQSSVTTFAAFNNWGGRSLYGFNSAGRPARRVSFDRPYAVNPYGVRLDGAGDFLRRWEYNAVRFLEREGYDVAYTTDVDTHQRPIDDDARPRHTIFLSVGFDAYWSRAMRDHVEAARDRGLHLAFLGAAACLWQIRFERNTAGDADRTIVGYPDLARSLDPVGLDADPRNDRLLTGRWRDAPVFQPEERLVGVMYDADPIDADIVVDRASHWAFTGTSLKHGDALPGLLGLAVDAVHGEGPLTTERLAHSPYPDPAARGRTRYADMTMYTTPGGALVFATGSMNWNWGLDDYNAPGRRTRRASEAARQITRTVLNRMLQGRGASSPSAADTRRPSAIIVVALIVAAAAVLRAYRRRGSPGRRLT